MRVFRRRTILAVIAVTALGALALALGASGGSQRGERHGKKLFELSLAGSILSDPPIHGKTRGGVPWDLKRGEARLNRNGEFRLKVRRLVVAGTNSARPVLTISASLFCAPDSNPDPAFTTGEVPISERGDARIRQRVTVPARCLAPVVLVHPNGGVARYIAASGWQR
jgi:hypothetical protein